jgi:natural product precursor
MKQLNRIKLHKLSQAELAEKEEKLLVGGQCGCISICPCAYAGDKENPNDSFYGGSSSKSNDNANSNEAVEGNSSSN